MSSFTINKEEYIKAAGFCAGLAERKNHYNEQMLRIWCGKLAKVAGDEEYHKTFTRLYEWNAESVKRQYDDEEADQDADKYMASFIRSKQNAKMATPAKLKKLIAVFNRFSSSVLYQIEDEELSSKAQRTLNLINTKLLGILLYIEQAEASSSWGEFEDGTEDAA